MQKKNGFIATSLIYSFFLAFITLFLATVADYLQNKVLLNTIEEGIKTEINSEMTINDFIKRTDYTIVNSCDESSGKEIQVTEISGNIVNYKYKSGSTLGKIDFSKNIVQKCNETGKIVIKKVGG